jgi:hypothetical protein
MNPNPSHDDRFRLEVEEEKLGLGVRDVPKGNDGPSSLNSTSPTDASDILMIPAFFSKSTNRLSWFEYRMFGVAEDTLR